MDPVALEARGRYRDPMSGPLAEDELSDFQKQLAANPYARALIGPIRTCNYTGARLPVHFLQRFRAVFSLSTKQPEQLQCSIVPNNDKFGGKSDPKTGTTFSSSSSYIVNSRPLVEYLNVKRRWTKIVIERMRKEFDFKAREEGASKSGRDTKDWAHDEDMPNTILARLQRNATTSFTKHIEAHGMEYIVPIDDPEQRLPNEHDHRIGQTSTRMAVATSAACPANTTTPATSIVYNLAQLFTEEQMSSLPSIVRKTAGAGGSIAVSQDEATQGLHRALLKLGAYLATAAQPLSNK